MKIPAPPLDGSGPVDRANRGHTPDDGHLAYHGYYGADSPNCGPSNRDQAVVLYHQNNNERSDQTQREYLHEEAVAPLSPTSSSEEKRFPNIHVSKFSLTQTLLPMVAERIERYWSHVDHEEDYPGTASLPESPAKSPAFSLTQSTGVPRGGLKTAGLEESYYDEDLEAGAHSTEETEEMTKYLPRSAALLVSALQSSKKISLAPSVSVEDFLSQRPDTWGLEGCEKAAEALLESICQDDVDSVGEDAVRETVLSNNPLPSRISESDPPTEVDVGFKSSTHFGTGANETNVVVAGDDDDDSIGRDLARLTTSVVSIRRDLQNVDFSHLEEFGDRFITDDYSEGDGLLTRLKLWVSRGFIMEQKLVHTYVTLDGANDADNGNGASFRYVDNPVLVWSMVLMWSFVVLILLHPKIAALLEGGDEGLLADIFLWLFGNGEVGWM